MERKELLKMDPQFFDRADAHISLSNGQVAGIGAGKVSASMMYAAARFCAFITARGFSSGEKMSDARDVTVGYFVKQFKIMLEENIDDYIENFDAYTKADAESDNP